MLPFRKSESAEASGTVVVFLGPRGKGSKSRIGLGRFQRNPIEYSRILFLLRMGEALGLKWSDIDLEAGTLRVNRQLHRVREGGGLVFSEPKNASRRTRDLPQRALEARRTHRKN